jgi:hypothetical protein
MREHGVIGRKGGHSVILVGRGDSSKAERVWKLMNTLSISHSTRSTYPAIKPRCICVARARDRHRYEELNIAVTPCQIAFYLTTALISLLIYTKPPRIQLVTTRRRYWGNKWELYIGL